MVMFDRHELPKKQKKIGTEMRGHDGAEVNGTSENAYSIFEMGKLQTFN